MHDSDILNKSKDLIALLEKHLGARGPTLKKALRRAGRRLPKALRAKAALLVEAEQMAAHPKLARRIDHDAVDRAYREIEAYLSKINLAEQRMTRRLSIAAGLAFKLLVIAVLVLVVLRWRGLA